jgi:hypothetical protein
MNFKTSYDVKYNTYNFYIAIRIIAEKAINHIQPTMLN